MGLLSRFKHSSTSNTASASSSKQAITNDDIHNHNATNTTNVARPTTPNSQSYLSPDLYSPPKLSRPSIPPPSPSSSSITSRIFSKNKDKDKDKKGKGKQKEIDSIGGIPYDNQSTSSSNIHSPLLPPTILSQNRTVSAPNSPKNSHTKVPIEGKRQRRSTLLSFDQPPPTSPLAITQSLSADKDLGLEESLFDHDGHVNDRNSSNGRRDKVSSGQFKQVGGILGQLNFELDSPKNSPPEKWLRRSSNPPVSTDSIGLQLNTLETNQNDPYVSNDANGLTPSITNESMVMINKDEIPPQISSLTGQQQIISYDTVPDISQTSTNQGSSIDDGEQIDEENKVELLESAEKKNKFWKRPRRSSKSHVDTIDIDRSTSPTPHGNSRNDTSLDLTTSRPSVDINHLDTAQGPRPQQLRRPSSSFFHNPFARSVSRQSLAGMDIDNPTTKPDDGSFQLRGFRHVTGMMEVEGAGELEHYLSHVKKDTRSSMDLLNSPNANNEIGSTVPLPSPPMHTSPHPSTTPRQLSPPPPIPLSRPASIANSLASATGDDFITVNKVSVAAFRKGIRRPSENLTATMSDIGHGTPATAIVTARTLSGQHSPLHNSASTSDDEEDDIPLGMMKGKDMIRQKSSQSLSSMGHLGNNDTSASSMTKNSSLNTNTNTNSSKRPSTMFDTIERKSSPLPFSKDLSNATSGQVIQHLNPQIDRKSTPSPSPLNQSYSTSASATPNSTRTSSPGSEIIRKSSPNPGLNFTVHRNKQNKMGHQRNGSGSSSGFIVKTPRLTRDGQIAKSLADQQLDSPITPTAPVAVTATPTNNQSVQEQSTLANNTLVSSPTEMSPMDGYFSHLAPLIHDKPELSEQKISNSPGPASVVPAPGPPIVPLALPQPGDKTPASLNLPLPPDQMPDTPPKPPSALPNHDTNDNLSPGAKKRLSLLEEPMKMISGLWSAPPADDSFDPALVIHSMDAFGGEEEEEKKNAVTSGTKESDNRVGSSSRSRTSTPDIEEKVRSPLSERLAGIANSAISKPSNNLSKPSLAQIKIMDDPQDDGYTTERVKSPMSDSTLSPNTAITAIPPTSSVLTTDKRPVAKERIISSFARARKPSNKIEDSDESSSSEEESQSESLHHASKPKVKPSNQSSHRKGKVGMSSPTNSERKVPHGPRKPSTNRKRVSSMFNPSTTNNSTSQPYTTTPIKGGPEHNKENEDDDDEKPLGVLRNKASKTSLSNVRKIGKSPSVSNLALPRSESSSGVSTSNRPTAITNTNGNRPKTPIELGPIVQPLKDRSTDHTTSPVESTFSHNPKPISEPQSRAQSRNQSYNSTSSPPKAMSNNNNTDGKSRSNQSQPHIKRSPGQTLIKLPSDLTSNTNISENRKTASPDSSRSATTGGSVNYQPMTPKDSYESKRLQRDPMGNDNLQGPKRTLTNRKSADDLRQKSYSSMGQNQAQMPNYQDQIQNQWNANMNLGMGMGMGMGFDQNQMINYNMAMMSQMGMNGMNSEAMRNMMKQQWQMQFMAAAYRASEEEWERASHVSGHTNQTVPTSFGQSSSNSLYGNNQPYQHQQEQQQMSSPMAWNGMTSQQYPTNMMMNNNPYGYGYSPQGYAQNYAYSMQPQQASSSHGGGMYSYGTSNGLGAQSVFGGEFGPPPTTPSQHRFIGNPLIQQIPSSSTSNNQNYNDKRGRTYSSSQSQSVYIPSNLSSVTNQNSPSTPPSSWTKRNGSGPSSGDYSEISQNQGSNQAQSRRAKTQSQFMMN